MALDLKQGISRQLTKINIKTSTFMEETKSKTYIETLNSEIKNLKAQCGDLGYQMWLNNEFEPEQLYVFFEEIAEKYRLIQEQENMMEKLKENNRQVLGNEQGVSPSFGQAQNLAGNICPNCGFDCGVDAKFCRKCGTKL